MREDGDPKTDSFLDRVPGESEARSWIYVGAWTAIIFAAIPLATSFVRYVSRTIGSEAIALISIALSITALGVLLWLLVRRGRTDRAGYIWLAAIAVLLLLLMTVFRSPYPAETLHYVEYAVLGLLLFRALSHQIRDHSIYLLALIVGTMIGTLDEIFQWLTPGRYFEMADIALNFTGVALAQLVLATVVRPTFISGWPMPDQVRRLGAALVVLMALLGLCAVLLS